MRLRRFPYNSPRTSPRTRRTPAWIPTSVPRTWSASPRLSWPRRSSTSRLRRSSAQVGDKKVLLALSGGVDSSVVAALLIKAIGKQLICVHVNHGLMRKGESEQVVDVFQNQLDANLVYVDAVDRFLGHARRRGRARGQAQDHRRRVHPRVRGGGPQSWRRASSFLAQGTIYPDILESDGVKAHHNVGGLPDDLQFELVRAGEALVQGRGARGRQRARACPTSMVVPPALPRPRPRRALPRRHHPRPPGGAARGRRHPARRVRRRPASRARCGSTSPIVPDFRATGVRDGKRAFDWPVIIRAVNTVDAMTAEVPELDWAAAARRSPTAS